MKLYRSTSAKLIAGILAIVSLTACTLSLICIGILSKYGAYSSDLSSQNLTSNLFHWDILNDMDAASDYYSMLLADEPWTQDAIEEYQDYFDPQNTNFFFTITDFDTGELLLSNYREDYSAFERKDYYISPANYLDRYSEYYYDEASQQYYDYFGNAVDKSKADPALQDVFSNKAASSPLHVVVVGHVRKNLNLIKADKYAAAANVGHFLYSNRMIFLLISAVGALVFLNCIIFVLYGAGMRPGSDQVFLRLVDRVPFDVFLLLVAGLTTLGVALFFSGFEDTLYSVPSKDSLTIWGLFSLSASSLLVLTLNSVAVRFRAKTLWSNTLLSKCFALFSRPLCWIGRLFLSLPLVWKSILICLGILAAETYCVMQVYWLGSFVPIILFNVVVVALVLTSSIHVYHLRKACTALADGDLDFRVDTRYMPSEFKAHGEELNRIGTGISSAVEERIKSELFKTELITNVSHDLKTPLTSIVNYVDLLSKLDLPEEARAYVEVLERQSHRLRKLTLDLVEASKASTGNLPVEISPICLDELIGQVAGEYEDRFKKAQLTPVLQMPEHPILVLGDGRYLWRIMDNLMSNVCKYTLSGTRVYIFAACEQNTVSITVKNISRDPLSITPEQLMERFVRGDASRNTEGSGLGLSIAESLAELMNGSLTLSIDGDLFKAELKLPAAPESESSEEPAE